MTLTAPSFVVERRINHPMDEVQRGLADRTPLAPAGLLDPEAEGFLCIIDPLRPVRPYSARQPTPTWWASAHLLTARRRLVAKVDLEVSMWSHDATGLTLRPAARHPERWRAWRVRNYFALAHDAADETARLIARRATSNSEIAAKTQAEPAFSGR